MPEVSIRMVRGNVDLEAVRLLCREWLAWHWKIYPSDWPTEGNPLEPARFEKVLTKLPLLHARPRGDILVAYFGMRPAGCVMYNEADADCAEFFRMYVSEQCRGRGLGQLLLDHMFDAMRADGYKKVVFSSANFLTHAKNMYEDAGFTAIPHPNSFPQEWRDYVYFMERSL